MSSRINRGLTSFFDVLSSLFAALFIVSLGLGLATSPITAFADESLSQCLDGCCCDNSDCRTKPPGEPPFGCSGDDGHNCFDSAEGDCQEGACDCGYLNGNDTAECECSFKS